MICLVDQNDGVRRNAPHALDEIGDGLDPVDGRRRVVRIVEEDEARAANRRDHRLEVELARRIDFHFLNAELPPVRHLRAVLERRRRRHEMAVRRREGAHGALENLLRAGAKDDVLGFRLVGHVVETEDLRRTISISRPANQQLLAHNRQKHRHLGCISVEFDLAVYSLDLFAGARVINQNVPAIVGQDKHFAILHDDRIELPRLALIGAGRHRHAAPAPAAAHQPALPHDRVAVVSRIDRQPCGCAAVCVNGRNRAKIGVDEDAPAGEGRVRERIVAQHRRLAKRHPRHLR